MGHKGRPKLKRRIKRRARTGRQCAAIPFRRDEAGDVEVLLLTSRGTGRWVIPKGWASAKLTSAEAAAREAFEEGGVVGHVVGKAPAGRYRYEKRLAPDHAISCEVAVFPLEVERQVEIWPEREQRELRWVSPRAAAALVDEAGLAEILLGMETATFSLEPAPRRQKRDRRRGPVETERSQ